jgi:phosphatidate cytidylyltransferase
MWRSIEHLTLSSLLLVLHLSSEGVLSFTVPTKNGVSTTGAPWRRRGSPTARIFLSTPPGNKPSLNEHQEKKIKKHTRFLPKRAVQIYADYAGRLWNETNTKARQVIANDKVLGAIRQIQAITRATKNAESPAEVSQESLELLEEACDTMLHSMGLNHTSFLARSSTTSIEQQIEVQKAHVESSSVEITSEPENAPARRPEKKKGRRSIMFGSAMGLAVAGWVFSGNYIFTGLFTLMTILGQLEYYRMIMNTGVYPARRISIVGACSMFLTALFTPDLHQICLPIFGMWSMIWFLTMKRSVTTIPEIATTFTGMFYLGYVPSFWVRVRLIGAAREPTRLAPIVAPVLKFLQLKAETALPAFIPQAVHLPITSGAIFIFWSWLCLAFSDVGAYFVGKNFGKTKLGRISPAAGATSPNKSVEGVIGGCVVSGMLGVFGAWVQRWPYFLWTGAAHGVMLALLGLLGDLTASMLKRDSGLKDFGDLIPEHGGILDRVDSFVWTAPYSWLVCAYVIPALKQLAR